MIYDPRRRAEKLRQRIVESMTAEEMEEYASQTGQPEKPDSALPDSAPPEHPTPEVEP